MKVKVDFEVLTELMEKATRLKVADELAVKHPNMEVKVLRTVFAQNTSLPPYGPTEMSIADKSSENDLEQEAEAPEGTLEKKSSSNSRKKIDSGKVLALRNAKWSVAKIAEEMCCTVAEINQILKEESK